MTSPPTHLPGQATIYRDDWGVPHIYAGSRAAGFFALGYAQAEDRPTRTLYLFLFARGETARLSGEAALAADIRNRLWRHREMAERGVERLTDDLRAGYEAYLAGIRTYFDRHPARRPKIDLQPDLADVLAVERAAFFFGYQANYAEAKSGRAASGSTESASNGWAVMPARTAESALILSADPHVQNMSAYYYEYRIEAGGLKSAGFSLGPFLWQAHTRDVAWAMTTGGPDVVDVYEVETDPEDPSRYLYDGEPRHFLTRAERFEVKGGAPVEKTFEYTLHNGVLSPVIERRGARAYVASAPAMDHASRFGREILDMNLAVNVFEVRDAMQSLGMFQQNLIIGDRTGNLLYVRAGATAVRPAGYDWDRPVPGNTSATAWLGLQSLDRLVQVLNPKTGYLQNNNVAPDAMAAERLIDPADYPADVFNDVPGRTTPRGIRATEVLANNARMTTADAFALSMDETWVEAHDWIAALSRAVEAHPDYVGERSPGYRRALSRLLAFDGVARSTSEAAATYLLWRKAMSPRQSVADDDASALPLLESLDDAFDKLERLGGAPTLGDLYRVGRGDRAWPIGGVTAGEGEATMRALRAADTGGEPPWRVAFGSQAMRLVAFTAPIQSFTLYAFGQSDDPASPHFNDQAKLFSEKRMKPAYFEFVELEGHVASVTRLVMSGPTHQA